MKRLLPILVLAVAIVAAVLFLRPFREEAPVPPPVAAETPAPVDKRPPPPAPVRAIDPSAPSGITMNSPGVLPYKPARPPAPLDGPLDKTFTPRPTSDPRLARTPDKKLVINNAVEMSRRIREPDPEAGTEVTGTEDDLQILGDLLSLYRRFNRENPVGDNSDVMRALMGENHRNFTFVPADHPAINELGQLLDPWGVPYYFHAISGVKMDIWSSGADREFGTSDDVKLYGEEEVASDTGGPNPDATD